MLGLDDRAGEFPGWGPIPATAARRTVARQRRAQWRWVVVDSDGHLLASRSDRCSATSEAARRPPTGMLDLPSTGALVTAAVVARGTCVGGSVRLQP